MKFFYSAVIPAFNSAATIRQAIQSVTGQTLAPAEIIVVDDGSTDDTAEIVRQCAGDISLVRQTNKGPGAATTAGIAQVSQPYFATLDADDVWGPEKIEKQAAYLENNSDIDAVFSLARLFAENEDPLNGCEGAIQRLWTRTTMVYRTDTARQVGDFLDFPGFLGETIDWLARARDIGHRHAILEEVLAYRRMRPGSFTDQRSAEDNKSYLAVIGRAMQRKKQRAASAKQ